jgi:NTP pyrophosphatase (non-canonical NTP hydrolase)
MIHVCGFPQNRKKRRNNVAGFGPIQDNITINSAVDVIGRWAQATFRGQSNTRVVAHLQEETRELERAVESGDRDAIADECADVFILLASVCKENRVDLALAVRVKHASNAETDYKPDPTTGFDRRVDREIGVRP